MDLVGWMGWFNKELVDLYGIVVWMRVFYENRMGNIHVKTCEYGSKLIFRMWFCVIGE